MPVEQDTLLAAVGRRREGREARQFHDDSLLQHQTPPPSVAHRPRGGQPQQPGYPLPPSRSMRFRACGVLRSGIYLAGPPARWWRESAPPPAHPASRIPCPLTIAHARANMPATDVWAAVSGSPLNRSTVGALRAAPDRLTSACRQSLYFPEGKPIPTEDSRACATRL